MNVLVSVVQFTLMLFGMKTFIPLPSLGLDVVKKLDPNEASVAAAAKSGFKVGLLVLWVDAVGIVGFLKVNVAAEGVVAGALVASGISLS